MAEPARPLEQAPPRRPPLRAVPPPRGPSAHVIRRRRAVALSALALLVALPLVALNLGGGSESGRISALLTRGASDPATLCDHLSSGMLAAIGGHDACVAASPERAPAATVENVRVDGDAATAVVVRDTGEERVRLLRQNGDWKVDDVR
jgi:hypothetical protein